MGLVADYTNIDIFNDISCTKLSDGTFVCYIVAIGLNKT